MIYKYESNEGTYGAFLNPVTIGPRTKKTTKIVSHKTPINKTNETINKNIFIP